MNEDRDDMTRLGERLATAERRALGRTLVATAIPVAVGFVVLVIVVQHVRRSLEELASLESQRHRAEAALQRTKEELASLESHLQAADEALRRSGDALRAVRANLEKQAPANGSGIAVRPLEQAAFVKTRQALEEQDNKVEPAIRTHAARLYAPSSAERKKSAWVLAHEASIHPNRIVAMLLDRAEPQLAQRQGAWQDGYIHTLTVLLAIHERHPDALKVHRERIERLLARADGSRAKELAATLTGRLSAR